MDLIDDAEDGLFLNTDFFFPLILLSKCINGTLFCIVSYDTLNILLITACKSLTLCICLSIFVVIKILNKLVH